MQPFAHKGVYNDLLQPPFLTFRTYVTRLYRPLPWTSRTLVLLFMPNRGYFQTIRIYDFRILGIADTSRNLVTVILQLSYNRQSSILQSSPVITNYHTNLTIYSPHLFTSYHTHFISHYSHITLFVTLFAIPLFTIRFLPYIPFPLHIISPLSPLISYHPAIILTIHNLTPFVLSPFSYSYIPLQHFLVTPLLITIATTLSLTFIIIITCPIFHPPISILIYYI